MPRAKRNRLVSLTKTKKKTSEHKEQLVKKIKQALKQYDRVIVFEHHNLTTLPFREIQQNWKKDSKFFLGKNKVMQIALGKTEETQATKNSYLLSNNLKGDRGLLFTSKSLNQVKDEFFRIDVNEFARAGFVSPTTIVLEKGVEAFQKFAFSIEPYLRKLGLNTQLVNQQIVLNENFVVAQTGKALSVEQSKILKLLDIKLAKFQLIPICVLEKNGSFKQKL